MKTGKRSGLCICAGLLTMALLSACGNSNSSAIPATASIFYAHTVVFKNHSTLLTTGYNGFGQLGNGNLTSQTVLTTVPGLGPVDRVALGADHTLSLAFSNVSSVYAWGSNYHGQIGNAAIAITGSAAYSATPVKVPLHGTVTGIAAGGFHSLAVVNGKVWSWGYNGYGQLGNGNFTDTNIPVTVGPAPDTGGNQLAAVSVAAGGSHSLALTADGRVYGWGNNAYGQAGYDPTVVNAGFLSSPGPTVVQFRNVSTASIHGTLTGVTKIAAGGSSSYALDANNQVWAWGYNNSGQVSLDQSVATNLYSFQAVQVQFPLLATGDYIVKISAGLDHALALTNKGFIYAWGLNQFAQLGNNDLHLLSQHTPVLVLEPGTTTPIAGVTDIVAFGNYSLALWNGVWYGWGDNSYGQLANPVSNTSIGYFAVPVKLAGFN